MTTDVNYSIELLDRDATTRAPIRAVLQRLIERYRISGKSVVELGSGLGFNLEAFQPANAVLGLEGLPEAAAAASARGIPSIPVDLERPLANLDDGAFDLALCLDVLEHLMNPLGCIRETHRILKPGGLYVVNVPNHFSLGNRLKILAGAGVDAPRYFPENEDWDYPHVRFFRHPSILSVLEFGGFVIEEDWSTKFPAVPVLRNVAALAPLTVALARLWPGLFCGGFFLIARKR